MVKSRISKSQWKFAQELYESGRSVAEVSRRTKIAESTIYKRMKDAEWEIPDRSEFTLDTAIDDIELALSRDAYAYLKYPQELIPEKHSMSVAMKNLAGTLNLLRDYQDMLPLIYQIEGARLNMRWIEETLPPEDAAPAIDAIRKCHDCHKADLEKLSK